LPVRPFEPLAAEAPAVTEPVTPPPAPPPPEPRSAEPGELLVTEYVLEPDPQERTLEEVLRHATDRRIDTPLPLEQTALYGTPLPAAPVSVTPAPVPRFVELSLEDAGGEGLELPAMEPPPPSSQGGADPGYVDLQLDEDLPPPAE